MSWRIHNRIDDRELWKTELQWAKKGRLLNEDAVGEEMWPNRNCQRKTTYYLIEATHEAGLSEMKNYRSERRSAQKVRKIAREKALERYYREPEFVLEVRGDGRRLIEKALQLPVIPCNNPSGIVVFDVETTGLDDWQDEILQLSAIDGDGNTLINTYVKPYRNKFWWEAEKIHGISPKMVQNAPEPHELIPKVRGILEDAALLVSYNGEFDMGFLANWGIELFDVPHFDVMREFAPIYGEWNDYFNDYKWQKLKTCAWYYDYEFKAHDSLEDVRATLHCYKKMMEE